MYYFYVGIYYQDPKGNKIAQWNGVQDPNGVIADQLVMSEHPVLGDWKIKVSQGVSLHLIISWKIFTNNTINL